jgi:hypothetical protein
MVNFVTKGRTQKLPKIFKIVEIYWHNHSLKSSWGALSDVNHFLGENVFSEFFSKNLSLKNFFSEEIARFCWTA